ncbi:MAG: MOSC domain-containing protein [Gemmatimonadaceae bacterium]
MPTHRRLAVASDGTVVANANPRPRVVSVNVGAVRSVEWQGEVVQTGIWKSSIGAGSVRVEGVNLVGDDQADRTVHGGPDKAVYAYATEDYDHWRDVEGIATEPGLFGENLTVEGIALGECVVGERWLVGDVLLEVAQPRLPCYKLGIRLGDSRFTRRFMQVSRLGAYLRIVRAGSLRAGDSAEVVERPTHGVTLGLMGAAVRDPTLRERLLAAPQLPPFWR